MIMKLRFLILLLAFVLIFDKAYAEIASVKLPSAKNLAMLLGTTDRNKVEENIYNSSGKISSKLPVKDDYRGETAKEISILLSNGSKELENEFYDTIEIERKAFEKFLSDNNFETLDMGVAYATCFIVLWEMASHTKLSEESALSLGKFLVYTFSNISEEYKNISDVDKSKAYDWLMTTPIVFASLINGYEKKGLFKETARLREKSASLFVETFKLPHDFITVSKSGELGVDIIKIQQYHNKNTIK